MDRAEHKQMAHGLENVLGEKAWRRLPAAVQARFGSPVVAVDYVGEFEIVRASLLGLFIAWLCVLIGKPVVPRTGRMTRPPRVFVTASAIGYYGVHGDEVIDVSNRPVTHREFQRTLAGVLRRPLWLRVPAVLLRAALGEMAQVLVDGQRVIPSRATELGFRFRHAELRSALVSLFGQALPASWANRRIRAALTRRSAYQVTKLGSEP
jgi:hypothetical protein